MAYGITNVPKGRTFPEITFVANGTTYTYDGETDLDVSGVIKTSTDTTNRTWKMWLLTSGTFTVLRYGKYKTFDFCAVGGGGGGDGGHINQNIYGTDGSGGGGGQLVNSTGVALGKNTSVSVTIGAGGTGTTVDRCAAGVTPNSTDGSNTVVTGGSLSMTALGGNRGDGRTPGASRMSSGAGKGAMCTEWNNGYVNAQPPVDGTYAFNDSTFDGKKYGAGGGAQNSSSTGYAGATYGGGAGVAVLAYPRDFPAAYQRYAAGANGVANSGSGGGGGLGYSGDGGQYLNNYNYAGGNGGSGIVCIRCHTS